MEAQIVLVVNWTTAHAWQETIYDKCADAANCKEKKMLMSKACCGFY